MVKGATQIKARSLLLLIVVGVVGLTPLCAVAQIFLSAGNHSQNFDSLGNAGGCWTNNVTLPGWYASKDNTENTNFLAGTGVSATGGIYSFGVGGVSNIADRALGSIATTATTPVIYGVRFSNDTAFAVSNITVTYAGEQWRSGNSTNLQVLAFSYQINNMPITNAFLGTWNNFTTVDFPSPNLTGSSSALDGNAAANRQIVTNVILTGAVVQPGFELFLRWMDEDDSGLDNGLAIDDVTVAFNDFIPPESPPSGTNLLTLVQYNVKGNGAADWSTNSVQVQAIGRQLVYLSPDIVTFNEIPSTNRWQITNWINAWLNGYSLAANSGNDGFICSAIVSRYPITRSTKWLDGIDLKPFGYTNDNPAQDNFTRDLFEAEVAVPGFPQHLHVFTTHLKSSSGTNYSDSAAKRAAETAAITNFFATNLFLEYPTHPYLLAGDMNESNTKALAIQHLASAPTGLRLTTPVNPFTGSKNTYSIQDGLSERIDYIFPCTLLFSNIAGSQIFRTDKLYPTPPGLLQFDDETASDHLPVVMIFNNPYDKPFRTLSIVRSNQNISLNWESVIGQPYCVEASSNLTIWTTFISGLVATNGVCTLDTNITGDTQFFRVLTCTP